MFEFKDEGGVMRFFRMEDQLEIADNKTMKFVKSTLNSKIKDVEEFYQTLQGKMIRIMLTQEKLEGVKENRSKSAQTI